MMITHVRNAIKLFLAAKSVKELYQKEQVSQLTLELIQRLALKQVSISFAQNVDQTCITRKEARHVAIAVKSSQAVKHVALTPQLVIHAKKGIMLFKLQMKLGLRFINANLVTYSLLNVLIAHLRDVGIAAMAIGTSWEDATKNGYDPNLY
jgi:hypothetical protein